MSTDTQWEISQSVTSQFVFFVTFCAALYLKILSWWLFSTLIFVSHTKDRFYFILIYHEQNSIFFHGKPGEKIKYNYREIHKNSTENIHKKSLLRSYEHKNDRFNPRNLYEKVPPPPQDLDQNLWQFLFNLCCPKRKWNSQYFGLRRRENRIEISSTLQNTQIKKWREVLPKRKVINRHFPATSLNPNMFS